MESITNIFKGSASLNIIFLVLAAVSIILAVIFYYKSLRIKRPVFSRQTFRLIDKKISAIKGIEIKHNNQEVENLSLTKIAIWNSGKESLRKSDIASTDLLRILATENTIIYDCTITFQNDVNNVILLKESVKSINISFEFLDFNEGFVMDVYHSGNNSKSIIIKGTLIGAEKISQGVKFEYFTKKLNFLNKPMDFLMNHGNFFARTFGWVLALPFGMLMIPLYLITLPIDFFIDKTTNKIPKDFYLFD